MQESVHVLVLDTPVRFYGDRHTKVWLECNGEPYGFRLLADSSIRKIADEIELVSFTCPRCAMRHQSFRHM